MGFPLFPRKNNKIESQNEDQTSNHVLLTNEYTHIKYCLNCTLHVVHILLAHMLNYFNPLAIVFQSTVLTFICTFVLPTSQFNTNF